MSLRARTVVPFALLLLAAVALVAVRWATVDCGQIADMDECETTWGCTVAFSPARHECHDFSLPMAPLPGREAATPQ